METLYINNKNFYVLWNLSDNASIIKKAANIGNFYCYFYILYVFELMKKCSLIKNAV